MGEQVKIIDLARNMIRLSGQEPEPRHPDRDRRPAPGREAARGAVQRGRAPGADRRREDHEGRAPAARPGMGRGRCSTRSALLVAQGDAAGLAAKVAELVRASASGDAVRRATWTAAASMTLMRRCPGRPLVSDQIEQYGSYAGLAAVLGLGGARDAVLRAGARGQAPARVGRPGAGARRRARNSASRPMRRRRVPRRRRPQRRSPRRPAAAATAAGAGVAAGAAAGPSSAAPAAAGGDDGAARTEARGDAPERRMGTPATPGAPAGRPRRPATPGAPAKPAVAAKLRRARLPPAELPPRRRRTATQRADGTKDGDAKTDGTKAGDAKEIDRAAEAAAKPATAKPGAPAAHGERQGSRRPPRRPEPPAVPTAAGACPPRRPGGAAVKLEGASATVPPRTPACARPAACDQLGREQGPLPRTNHRDRRRRGRCWPPPEASPPRTFLRGGGSNDNSPPGRRHGAALARRQRAPAAGGDGVRGASTKAPALINRPTRSPSGGTERHDGDGPGAQRVGQGVAQGLQAGHRRSQRHDQPAAPGDPGPVRRTTPAGGRGRRGQDLGVPCVGGREDGCQREGGRRQRAGHRLRPAADKAQ